MKHSSHSIQSTVTMKPIIITKKKTLRSFYEDDDKLAPYLTNQFKLDALIDCDLPRVFTHIYNNPEHPENHCIKLISKVPSIFYIHTGNGSWKEVKGEKVLIDIIETCFRFIFNYYVFNKDEADERIKQNKRVYPVKAWLEEMNEEDEKLYASTKESIMNVIPIKMA